MATFKSCVPRKYMSTKAYLLRGSHPKEKFPDGHLFKEICANCGDAMGFHQTDSTCYTKNVSLTKTESNG